MTHFLRTALALSLIAAAPATLAQTAEQQATQEETQSQAPAEAEAAPSSAPEAPAAEAEAADQQAQQEPPREVVTATHGDWSIVCAASGKPCDMRQNGSNAQGQQVMKVRIQKIKPQQTQQGTVEAGMEVLVPLGVLLPAGIRIQIDSAEPTRAGYTVCGQGGCMLQQALPNRMIAALKRGAKATMTIVAPPNREIAVPISLSGFTAAYDALEP